MNNDQLQAARWKLNVAHWQAKWWTGYIDRSLIRAAKAVERT